MSEEEKKTLGEELYLVHLERFNKEERSPEDFDLEAKPKPREITPGEELWLVHCKRTAGVQLEEDCEQEPANDNKNKKKKAKRTAQRRVLHLRNRDVAVLP